MAKRQPRIHPDYVMSELRRLTPLIDSAILDVKHGYIESAKEMIESVTQRTMHLTSTLWKGERVKRHGKNKISRD